MEEISEVLCFYLLMVRVFSCFDVYGKFIVVFILQRVSSQLPLVRGLNKQLEESDLVRLSVFLPFPSFLSPLLSPAHQYSNSTKSCLDSGFKLSSTNDLSMI